jgi:hypothetical protein
MSTLPVVHVISPFRSRFRGLIDKGRNGPYTVINTLSKQDQEESSNFCYLDRHEVLVV